MAGGRSADPVVMAWCGPPDHGVTMFGRELFDHAAEAGFGGTALTAADPAALAARLDDLPRGTRLVHLQVNDWLFADAELAARERLCDIARRLRATGVALSMTVHDLPHRAVSPELYRRRIDTYAAAAAVAIGIVVASEHEARLLATAVRESDPTATPPVVTVIPLPVGAAGSAVPARPDRAVGVFGFVYPGKGHAEVVDALVGLDPPVEVRAIGRASTGHEELPAALARQARDHGMTFRSTGFLAAAEVTIALRAVAVPVAPAAQVSASGSLNSWIAAGRRPLALAGDYTREFAARHPGAVRLYEPAGLREQVVAALADPASTWLPPGTVVDAGPAVTARRYVAWLRARVQQC